MIDSPNRTRPERLIYIMSLSKKRDKERKRLGRLNSNLIQPNVRPPVKPIPLDLLDSKEIIVIGGTPFRRLK